MIKLGLKFLKLNPNLNFLINYKNTSIWRCQKKNYFLKYHFIYFTNLFYNSSNILVLIFIYNLIKLYKLLFSLFPSTLLFSSHTTTRLKKKISLQLMNSKVVYMQPQQVCKFFISTQTQMKWVLGILDCKITTGVFTSPMLMP